jgi:hypothetical protein
MRLHQGFKMATTRSVIWVNGSGRGGSGRDGIGGLAAGGGSGFLPRLEEFRLKFMKFLGMKF